MKKLGLLFSACFLLFSQSSFAIEYEGIYENNQVVYSPSSVFWSEGVISKDSITLVKHLSSTNLGYSNYKSDCIEITLNSDFEFLYLGRLIGVDNKNLKFYEITYANNVFTEKLLTYEQVQEIFGEIDVIKISDFSNGIYNIINYNHGKEIILLNDTDIQFVNYVIKPEKVSINKDIKANIILPRRGKIVLYNVNNENDNKYIIKVK